MEGSAVRSRVAQDRGGTQGPLGLGHSLLPHHARRHPPVRQAPSDPGRRYEAGRPIADEVIEAAKPFVDVLSFQHFAKPEAVGQNLALWHQRTGKPVLLADHAVIVGSADGSQRHDGAGYAETLRRLRELPGCIGFHLCGAYLRNECRQRALREASEKPDDAALPAITQAKREAADWMRRAAGQTVGIG